MKKIEPPKASEKSPGSTPASSVIGDLSPIQLTALTALAIFVGEALIMFIMPIFSEIPVAYQAILDAVFLTLLTAPVLSFLLFRPMVQHIKERRQAEHELLKLNTILERRVDERTSELTRSNKALNHEVLERRATEERIRRANAFVQRLVESIPCLLATIDANSLKLNYVNSRIEDFLGFSPEDVALSKGSFFDSIIPGESKDSCTKMVRDITIAPHGEIARGRVQLRNSDGGDSLFRVGVVVVSRTEIGEAEEVLFVATPVDDCA